MKPVWKKLRSKAGESLVEVLCAILIFTLASVGMYSMVMAANNINATAKEADDKFQENMLVVEKAEGAGQQGTITMTPYKTGSVPGAEGPDSITVNVEVYRNGDVFSYFKAD